MGAVNTLFFSLLVIGPLVSVSSDNWIVCWGGMELSFLGLIPLMFLSNKYISLTKESTMKYFCMQALGSAVIFCGGNSVFSSLGEEGSMFLLVFGILTKLGAFPMHFWVPSVVAGLGLAPMYLILTFQKIAPFAFMSLNISGTETSVMKMIALLGGVTSIVGALIGYNQTDLFAMLGSSSVAHSGWMVLGLVTGNFWSYFFVYCVMLFFSFCFLYFHPSSTLAGVGILALSGLPPFVMFLGKWLILKAAVASGIPMLILGLFLVGAVISLGFYLKFTYSLIMNSLASAWVKGSSNTSLFFVVVNFFVLLFFLLV